ncbi:Protein kinase, putative [Hondaea fermentalgiana]|uniref:Protein kinase, putative n=1 Tax=Hondaea fermentalgiana TaxID=2315210 RepID=A0A2R5G438_9STRA|nr:Protein kinase, putative [Hondaea fermentalgiana]|eukprot:GBG25760.1 Protein kinase, putative [Hondaea fermentalgiana]
MDLASGAINWSPKGAAGWSPLHLAAACGDMKRLVTLLDCIKEEEDENKSGDERPGRRRPLQSEDRSSSQPGNRLEARASSGDRAFHVALRNGQVLAARELARAGCDVHAKGKDGETAAHICALMDMAEELTWMIRSHKLDPTVTTDRGETVIHCASRECRISFLQWATRESFCTPEFFCQVDKLGQTCAHYAARNGIRTGVKWVLDFLDSLEKKDPEFDVLLGIPCNNQGKDPCALARSEGHYMCAELLDEYKKTKSRDRKFRKQALKRMFDAARRNNLKSVQTLHKKHSRHFDILAARNPRSGNCAIFEAAAAGSTEIVRWILDRAARDDFSYIESRLEEKLSHLKDWLADLDMEDWLDKMCEEGFDSLERAQLINEEDLADWGMKKGYRRSFLRALESLRTDDAEPDTTTDAISEPPSPAAAAATANGSGASSTLAATSTTSSTASTSPLSSSSSLLPPSSAPSNKPSYTALQPLLYDEMLNDLREGDEVTIDGFTAGNKYARGQPRRYVLRRSGPVYECTCPEWKLNQGPREARTCDHLKEFRGEQAELRRIDLQRMRMFQMQSLQNEIRNRVARNKITRSFTVSGISSGSDSKVSSGESAHSGSNRLNPSRSLGKPLARSQSVSGSVISRESLQESVGVPSHQILAYEELTFGQIIGEGSFGVVRAAEWRGMLVAVKELRGNEKLMLAGSNPSGVEIDTALLGGDHAGVGAGGAKAGEVEGENNGNPSGLARGASCSSEEWDLKHEAAMMSRVSNHENIVPFVGVLLTPRPCVVTKLMRGGSVEDMLVVPGPLYKRKTIPEARILQMLVDAAAGVLHLHSEGVIHRDIASRNLLVDENLRVKVADFGFARIKEINRSKGYTSQHVGPIKWMAPEAMRYRRFSEQTDVFSFGVTLFEVLVGKRPWEGIESMDVVYRICDGERQLVPDEVECNQALRDLVKRCQRHGPEERPVMKEVHRILASVLQTSQTPPPKPPTSSASHIPDETPQGRDARAGSDGDGGERGAGTATLTETMSAQEGKDGAPRKSGCLEKVSSVISSTLAGAFKRLGHMVGMRPILTILISIVMLAIFGYGFANFESGDDQGAFVPQGTEALANRADIIEYYGQSPRFNSFMQKPSDNGNILDKENMVAALTFYSEMYEISVTALNEDLEEETFTLEDLCVQIPTGPTTSVCLFSSVFSAYANNLTTLEEDDNIPQTLNDTFSRDDLELYVGGVEYDASTGLPVSAKVLRSTLFLEKNPIDVTPNDDSSDTEEPAATAWEEAVVELANDFADAQPVEVYPFNGWAVSDQVGGEIVGDVMYQGISYFIIIIYIVVVLQNTCDRVRSSIALALLGILTIGLAIICGFGFSQLLGFTYGRTHTVLVFIILGIGADGIFIVTNSFRRASGEDGIPNRAAQALEHAGVSITVSSLTNVVAFALGSLTVIPDLSSFCKYAALTFFFLWIFLPTFFMACLVLNERRVTGGRLDLLCCFKDCRDPESGETAKGTTFKQTWLSTFLQNKLSWLIMQNWFRFPVILLALGFAAYCGYNITKLTVESTSENFIPDDSYLKSFTNAQARYFGGEDTSVYVVTEDMDYYANRAEVVAFPDQFRFPSTYETQAPYIRPTFDSWIEDFMAAMASPPATLTIDAGEVEADAELDNAPFPTSSDLFYKYLRLWLDDDFGTGAAYADDIIFTDSSRSQIVRARIQMYHVPIGSFQDDGLFQEDAYEVVNAVEKMYEICDAASFEAYAWGSEYTDGWASYAVVAQELQQNVLLALAAVFVMIFLFIGHPLASTLVFICVSISIVELLGLQTLMGLSIDTTSVVLFVLSVGVAVDYSAHIGYAYMTFAGSAEERLRGMLGDVAVPVLHGAMSTFLAVLMQAFSSSYVFRVVFQDFAVIVSAATLNGLILLPILLYTFNPPAYPSAKSVDAAMTP